jgi:hypothetical protein
MRVRLGACVLVGVHVCVCMDQHTLMMQTDLLASQTNQRLERELRRGRRCCFCGAVVSAICAGTTGATMPARRRK